jgi:hypothetical protein
VTPTTPTREPVVPVIAPEAAPAPALVQLPPAEEPLVPVARR